MDSLISRIFIKHWQRKLVALLIAIIVWMVVSQSIITTKTIHAVPIRIINVSANKSIEGLLPNGFLSQRITLNLSGSKEVIDHLEPGDIEVLLDATDKTSPWVVHITKKNLISLNPDIDLIHHITQISHTEFILKLVPSNNGEETQQEGKTK